MNALLSQSFKMNSDRKVQQLDFQNNRILSPTTIEMKPTFNFQQLPAIDGGFKWNMAQICKQNWNPKKLKLDFK